MEANPMQTMKGFAAGMVALVACPCHLPLTLPALLVLTSGTAVGGWLAANPWLVWLGSIVLFIGGLVLMLRWINPAGAGAHCEIPRQKQAQDPPAPRRIEQHGQSHVQSYANGSTQPKEASHV
jgi:hypothetical protein